MPKEITYWPVFLFNGGIVGEYLLLGIFNLKTDAEEFAGGINKDIPPGKPQAVVVEFTLDALKSNIVQYWVCSSFPEYMVSSAAEMLYGSDGKFPAAVAKTEESAA